MTVYVDDMYKYPLGRFGRMKMSHMMADTTQELLAMASTIGVAAKWIQDPGTHREHFDIAISKRKLAVEAGAVEVSLRSMAFFCNLNDQRPRDWHAVGPHERVWWRSAAGESQYRQSK